MYVKFIKSQLYFEVIRADIIFRSALCIPSSENNWGTTFKPS